MATSGTAASQDGVVSVVVQPRLAEHIQLQSEPGPAVDPAGARAVAGPFVIEDSLRACTTALTFLEGHLLGVRAKRGRQWRGYWLDLRFVAAEPAVRRKVAWRCLQATLALALLTVTSHVAPTLGGQPAWRAVTLPVEIVLATATACALALAWHRTRETVEFRSLHGGVTLFEITAGLGCRRRSQVFAAEFSRRVEQARRDWGQPQSHHLRDEMREHHRLHQAGVLPEEDYEAGKRRVLAAHG